MNLKHIFTAALFAAALSASAQGYQDGIDLYNADRLDLAKEVLENTLNQPGTDKGLVYFYMGSVDLREGKLAEAAQDFNAGIAADAAQPLNYVGLGQLELLNGNKKGAEEMFKTALKPNKKDATVLTAIARAYYAVDPVAYKKEIDKNIKEALKVSNNLNPDVYILQGDMALDNGDVGGAAAFYEQAIIYGEQQGRINPEGYVKYANAYISSNHKFATDKLEQLRSKAPNSALALRELAEKYYASEQYSRAANVYKDYMNNPNHFQQDEQRYSQLLFFDNKNQESLDIAKQVLAKDPDNYYMYRMVMLNDAALENWKEAEEYAEKLFNAPGAELTTMDYNTYANVLGQIAKEYNDSTKLYQAVAKYEEGYNANPEKNADMLASIAALFIDNGDMANAVRYQEMFVETPAAKLSDKYDLASYYGALGASYPEGSVERTEAINKGIKILDDNLDVVAGTGKGTFLLQKARMIFAREGKPTQEMMDVYDAMIDVYGGDETANPRGFSSAYLNKAIFYIQEGNNEESAIWIDKLEAVDPANPNIPALRAAIAPKK